MLDGRGRKKQISKKIEINDSESIRETRSIPLEIKIPAT